MQFSAAAKPPLGVLYDSGFGESIDTVLALALLHGVEGKRLCRIVSLTISKSNLKAAQLCDVIEKFYSSANPPAMAAFISPPTIGLAVNAKLPADTALITGTLESKDSDGGSLYASRIRKLNDTAIPEVQMRNALSAQHDGNAVIVAAGPVTNLVRLLDLPGAKEWIAAKTKVLVLAGGDFKGDRDPNFSLDVAGVRRILSDWPTPVILCGREVGAQLPYPGDTVETDFAYSPAHPVAKAYRAYQRMPYDAPSTAMAAMLYAAFPAETYFKLSALGAISVADDGRTQFKTSTDGRHRYLMVDGDQKSRILGVYRELASAKPVPRMLRRPQLDAADKDDEEKKDEKKDGKKPSADARSTV